MRCPRHPVAAGPDGRCALCEREDTKRWTLVAALIGLVAAGSLVVGGGVGGSVGYRLGSATSVAEVVARAISPAAMRATVVSGPAATGAPADPALDGRLREVQEALTKAWYSGPEGAGTEADDPRSRGAATAAASAEAPAATAAGIAKADPPVAPAASAANADARTASTTSSASADLQAAASTTAATASPPAASGSAANPVPAPTASAITDAPPASANVAVVIAAPASTNGTIFGDAGSSDVHVIMYSAPWCSACKLAEAWMLHRGVPFDERDVTASAEFEQEQRRLDPSGDLPTFDVDGDVMTGFNASRLLAMVRRAQRRRAGTL